MVLIVLVVLSFLLYVNAELASNYPINAQLPPVARVSKPFRFTFSQYTFSDSDTDTKYSLSKAPSWLQVDSKSRTLIGTPQPGDKGTDTFKLVAKDKSGSADMEVSLIVTTDEGPHLGKPILPQLEKIGPTSAPSAIFVHPGHSFSIAFDPDTFTNTHPSTVYYGTSQDNEPLPSWIGFDESALRFSGDAPGSSSSGPQTFNFHLIASDVAGYSAANVSFNIVVSTHILAFNESERTLNITRGHHFGSPHFIDSLTLDGEEPGKHDLTSVDMEAPDWVSLDKSTISISGTPPGSAYNENVTISVKDSHDDVAKLMVTLEFSQLFVEGVKGTEATIGEDFMFFFNQSVLTDNSVDLDVDLGKGLSSWLEYTPDNKTLHGRVPADVSPKKTTIELTATKGSRKDTREFTIDLVKPSHNSDGSSSSGSGGGGSSSGIHGKKAGIIAISVVVPCVVLGTALLLFCCWRRKRRVVPHEEEELPQANEPKRRPDISELPRCQPGEEAISDDVPEALRRHSSSSTPPQLELAPLWYGGSLEKKEETDDATNKENLISNSIVEMDFASPKNPDPEQVDVSPTRNKRISQGSPSTGLRATNHSKTREPLKPIQARRSMKRSSAASSKSRRNSKRSSGISSVASGLPVRLSGAGHGAGGFGPPGHGVVRLSWQNPQACLPSDESSLESLTPLFPRPPPVRTRESRSFSRPEQKRVSLRAIESQNSIISEADSFEEFVHSRAKCRNSSNPMFSGQGNRRVSSGLRAIERARNTLSPEGTEGSSIYNDVSTAPMRERPISTAMSASIYSDDNGPSAQSRSLSQRSSLSRNLTFSKRQSQWSLVQKYRDAAAPLPRFFSESSLASGRRGPTGNHSGGLQDYRKLVDEPTDGGQRPWYLLNSQSPNSAAGLNQHRFGRSSSTLSIAFPAIPDHARRASLMRFSGKDRRTSVEPSSSLARESKGSVAGDMAFV